MSITRKKVSDLLGQRFGDLVVVEYLGLGKHNKHYWRCVCDCGGENTLATYRLTNNTQPTKSCGCRRAENLKGNRFDGTKHGLHKHKLYAIRGNMLQRCYNPSSQRFMYYGLKGISVCQDWQDSFEAFYDWAMSNGYKEGLSIDRIDSGGNYEPSNCQWVTVSENSRRMNIGKRRRAVQADTCDT